jgi:hypothetical protein
VSKESEIAARLSGDATLMATLTGGVYVSGTVGIDGITRDATPAAFSGGYLLPCALVRQRGNIPDGQVSDETAQIDSAIQIVEVWFYQDSGYTSIDTAMERARVLLRGYSLTNSFPLTLANVIDRQRDDGALHGASLARQDWQVNNILGG